MKYVYDRTPRASKPVTPKPLGLKMYAWSASTIWFGPFTTAAAPTAVSTACCVAVTAASNVDGSGSDAGSSTCNRLRLVPTARARANCCRAPGGRTKAVLLPKVAAASSAASRNNADARAIAVRVRMMAAQMKARPTGSRGAACFDRARWKGSRSGNYYGWSVRKGAAQWVQTVCSLGHRVMQ